jgi:hypothetical protein
MFHKHVTKSLASDVMSDKSIDISENSLSDNASNCSKDFNNTENFSVSEGEDMKVCNSKSLPGWRRVRIPARSPASHKRRRKGNPVPRGYNWATLFLGDIHTGTWPSRLGSLV